MDYVVLAHKDRRAGIQSTRSEWHLVPEQITQFGDDVTIARAKDVARQLARIYRNVRVVAVGECVFLDETP